MKKLMLASVGALLFVGSVPASVSAANLDAVSVVAHGGVNITSGETIVRSDLTSVEQAWDISFTWPRGVVSSRTFLGVFRGSFGNVEGGNAIEGVNYASQQQSFQNGNNTKTKTFTLPALGDIDTSSSVYTVVVAERAVGVTHQATADWFASGGLGGIEPVDYAFLTFTYDGSFNAEHLSAITDVWHGGVTVEEGDTVLRKHLTSDQNMWEWRFAWPHAVENEQALFVLFRGTFGDLTGGIPEEGVNFATQLQRFPSGSYTVGKPLGLEPLKNESAATGVYTMAIMELDPKYLNRGAGEQIEWFATGGSEGIPPLRFDTLSFTFLEHAECCSNIAFIPGIKATELYEGDDRVWLPGLFDVDARRLKMNNMGESANSLEVGDPIGVAYRAAQVYEDFLVRLNEMNIKKIYADWESVVYDWRYDVRDVIENEQYIKGGEVRRIVEQVRALAERSDTGKVTVVAHSNGGLVGKMLIDALGADATNIIDNFIMVGTPQLGTPSAITAMLHGDSQGLPLDSLPLTLTRATSRELSENTPGAYGLLPLQQYFSTVLDPVISFTDASLANTYRSAYGERVDSVHELRDFLLGLRGTREKPARNNLRTPTILNDFLFNKASTTRSTLEAWQAPKGISVTQIAGWGKDTVSGAEYYERCHRRLIGGNECFLDVRPHFSVLGDATVITQSAASMTQESVDTLYFNMHAAEGYTHANMMAAPQVQQVIENILTGATSTPEHISVDVPSAASIPEMVRASVHSPVSISVQDPEGNTTGIATTTEGFAFIEQAVPNSYYLEFGEGKYVGFPAHNTHEIVLVGTGGGFFTLEIEHLIGGEVTDVTTFTDVAVATGTRAAFLVDVSATTTPALQVDTESDGVVDAEITADGLEDDTPPESDSEEANNIHEFIDIRKAIFTRTGKHDDPIARFIEKKTNDEKRKWEALLRDTPTHYADSEKPTAPSVEKPRRLRVLIERIRAHRNSI